MGSKRRPTLAQEVANASRVLESEFVQAARNTNDILAAARTIARLQAKRARLRRELRLVEQNLKHERKMLRAIAGATTDLCLCGKPVAAHFKNGRKLDCSKVTA